MQRVKSPLCLQNPTVMFKAKMYLSLVSFKRIIICLLLMSWRSIKLCDTERGFNLSVLLICIQEGHTIKCMNAVHETQRLTMIIMLDHKI